MRLRRLYGLCATVGEGVIDPLSGEVIVGDEKLVSGSMAIASGREDVAGDSSETWTSGTGEVIDNSTGRVVSCTGEPSADGATRASAEEVIDDSAEEVVSITGVISVDGAILASGRKAVSAAVEDVICGEVTRSAADGEAVDSLKGDGIGVSRTVASVETTFPAAGGLEMFIGGED